MKPFAVILSTVLLTACDQPAKDPIEHGYTPTLSNPIPFSLPAGDKTAYAASTKGYSEGGKVAVHTYQHPRKWVVYLASSNWSEAGTERSMRHVIDAQHLSALKKFIAQNKLSDRVAVAWLQYDSHPGYINLFAGDADGVSGWRVLPKTFLLQNTEHIFDYYVVSPASRLPGGKNLSISEWLNPYIEYADSPDGRTHLDVDLRSGKDDPSSKFWDRWNRHFFVVNPDGLVVDAYLNIGTKQHTWPDQPMHSLVHHLNIAPETVIYPEINRSAFYKSYFSEPIEDQFAESIQEAINGLSE